MEKKTKIILGVILLLLVVVIGTTYAFFTANVTTSGEDNKAEITAKAYANATMAFGNTINSEDALPGFKAVKSVTITGECQNNAETCEPITATIIVTADIPTEFNKDVTWYLIKSDTPINCENKINEVTEGEQVYSTGECEGITEELKNSAQKGNTTGTTKIDIEVTGQTNDTYYLYVEYANNGEQNEQQGKEFSITVNLEGRKEEPKPLNETIILADQPDAKDVEDAKTKIKAKTAVSFSSNATTDEGLHMAMDDLGESYYFRGNIPDNWVSFAGLYWRIVRVNGDGTVRLIYNGTSASQEGSGTQITTQAFNSAYNNPMHVGYKNGTYDTTKKFYNNTTNSTIKNYLENTWFNGALGSYTDYLADEIFCNDRTITSGDGVSTSATTYYGPYKRIITDKKPSLQCPQANDRFAMGTKVGNVETNGQIAQGKPVGLITADEVMMAGGTTIGNSSFYLYTNQSYWTMSPYRFGGSYALEWYVGSDGDLLYYSVNHTNLGVRAVINLKSSVSVAGGNGTTGDPYTLQLS